MRAHLKDVLSTKNQIKLLESHSGLSGIVANNSFIQVNGDRIEFDGIWCSSLTNSAIKGLPDTEIINLDQRISLVQEMLEVTNKPIIVDGDTGGSIENFRSLCRQLEKIGGDMSREMCMSVKFFYN